MQWNLAALATVVRCASASILPRPTRTRLVTAPSAARPRGRGIRHKLCGDSSSLRVEGEENITAFQARVRNPEDEEASTSPATRHFCSLCGSALWLYDPRWPELVHPFASAIDTPLPEPPEMVRIMLEFAAPWCDIPEQGKDERHFRRDPEESLEEWHRRHGLYEGA